MDEKVTIFHVQRFDPDKDPAPYFHTFPVPLRKGLTVLEGLFYILDKLDGSLAFKYSCRGAICGSSAMFINGAYRLACETPVASFPFGEVTVSPLPFFPIIRDLAVDMEPFLERFHRIRPYLISLRSVPEREWRQSPRDRKIIEEMTNCIMCGACHSSCPVAWMDKEFLGPAVFIKAFRLLADSRDDGGDGRLDDVGGSNSGVWRCHTIFNCAEVCPKRIVPTWSIQQLKGRSVTRRIKASLLRPFGLKR